MPTMPPHYAIARAHSNVDTDRRLEFTIALRFWGRFTEQLAITQEFRRKQFSLHINLERTKKKNPASGSDIWRARRCHGVQLQTCSRASWWSSAGCVDHRWNTGCNVSARALAEEIFASFSRRADVRFEGNLAPNASGLGHSIVSCDAERPGYTPCHSYMRAFGVVSWMSDDKQARPSRQLVPELPIQCNRP